MATAKASASAVPFNLGSNNPGWGLMTVSPTLPTTTNSVTNDLGNDVVVYIVNGSNAMTVATLVAPSP